MVVSNFVQGSHFSQLGKLFTRLNTRVGGASMVVCRVVSKLFGANAQSPIYMSTIRIDKKIKTLKNFILQGLDNYSQKYSKFIEK